MSQNISKQELVTRYVHEVKRILGKKAPADLGRELESLLNESIEAREAELGREAELTEVAGLIAAFGTPEEVAGRYVSRPSYLIGPGLYPAFLLVVKALAGVAAGVPLILLLVAGLTPGGRFPTFATGLANWFGLSYQIALSGLGWAVLVFAILERCGISTEYPKETWDPLSLPPVDDPQRASRIGSTVRLYFVIALMILFNLFPQWLGIYLVTSGQDPRFVSLDQLGIHLPMLALNVWWLFALLQNLLLLQKGRWTWPTRWLQFGLGIFGAAILYQIMRATARAVGQEAFSTAIGNPQLATILARLVPSVLFMILVIVLASSAHRLYHLVRPVTA
ncbi:MAG: hypothetical protein EHM61_05900 [Acidobacteria bacterium]|nr:MAG: hypothetical protein EHM61_05900 [Acidobacteriota bacterium]